MGFLVCSCHYMWAQYEKFCNSPISECNSIMTQLDSLEREYQVKPFVQYELGTSVFTNFDGMYGFNTYFLPRVFMKPSEKWIVDFGMFMSQTQLFYKQNDNIVGNPMKINQSVISLGAYVQGTYLINENLYIGGMGFLMHNSANSSVPQHVKNAYDNINGSTFVGYKFSDEFKVEVAFEVGDSTPYVPYVEKVR